MIPDNFSLEGKVALIVGDKQGWLGEMALYLAEASATVIIICDNGERIEQIVRMTEGQERKVTGILSNLTDYQEIENAVNRIISQWGKIDILVNNTGRQVAGPLIEVTEEDWDSLVSINLTAVFLWTKAVGKHMLERKQGSIINISSILAERSVTNSSAYCATSGGVGQFTKALALEWASHNIRINAIGVGWVDYSRDKTDKAKARLQRYITLGRFCQPDDIAALLVYFSSEASSYVTGQTYFVSGGVMAHG